MTRTKARFLPAAALLALVLATTAGVTASPALATGDASTVAGERCPNEGLVGFSEALSECRGFEMVTPPYKAGEEPTTMAVSTDGSHIINKSFGSYAGRQSGSTEATYLAGRGESGWGSLALSPSSALFPAQGYLTASPDLSRSLWRLRSASEPITGEDLYLRETDGSFVKVGSFVPPADEQGPPAGDDAHFYGQETVEYQDASSDLSHVLFDIHKYGPLWPFDATIATNSNHSSLYEYSGVRVPRPALVGVSDGRTVLNGFRSKPTESETLEPDSEVLQAGTLISDCQTKLGSEQEDGYNAVSADGSTIYFTAAGIAGPQGLDECENELVEHGRFQRHGEVFAPAYAPAVNELYARVGGGETVPVSEPTFEECVECQTGVKTPAHEPVVEQAAEFAGASEDGSKAFFLTRQELLPGETGMNLYEYDFDAPKGEHVLRVSGASGVNEANVLGVTRVSEDGSHVYFVAEGNLATNANRYGRTAVEGKPNLYLFLRNAAHPTGEIVFITPLSRQDSEAWTQNDNGREFQVTPDGRFAVFASRVDVASGGGVVEGSPQVFEFAAESGELVRVSTGQRGFAEGDANADVAGANMPAQNYITSSKELGPTSADTNLAVSSDGSLVVFSSHGALTESALAGTGGVGVLSNPLESNVYLFHSPGGVLSGGEVFLVSARARSLRGLDASGDDVFFESPVALLSSDVDGSVDIYDARVDGGVPVSVAPAPCSGEGCLGAVTGVPVLPGPGGSAVANGVSPVPIAVPAAPVPTPGANPRALTEAQKLSRALRDCRKRSKKARPTCEKRARRTYRRAK
jgi:hypothetical protein